MGKTTLLQCVTAVESAHFSQIKRVKRIAFDNEAENDELPVVQVNQETDKGEAKCEGGGASLVTH